jgi:hypothetical protein
MGRPKTVNEQYLDRLKELVNQAHVSMAIHFNVGQRNG